MELHENIRSDRPVKTGSDRSFGLVFASFFTLVGLWPLIHSGSVRYAPLLLGAVFALIAALSPALLAPLNRGWTRLGLLLNRLSSPVLLGIVFFLVVTPTGWVMRLLGKDLLRLRFQNDPSSYWISRNPPGPDPESLNRQF